MIGRIDSGGPGPNGTNRCAMTWRYLLCSCSACAGLRARGKVTDLPPCAPRSMAVVQVINDRLSHDARQRLAARIPLIPSVTDADPDTLDHVEGRAALWAARSVEHLSDDPRVRACNDVTERWLAGEATDAELTAAAAAAWAARAAAAWAARAAAAWAASGAAAAEAWASSAAAAAAEAWASSAAAAADSDDALLDWLDAYLAAWHKIAADEGLMGSCDWLDPADFVQAGGS